MLYRMSSLILLILMCASTAIADESAQTPIYVARFVTATDELAYLADSVQEAIVNQLSDFSVRIYDSKSGLGQGLGDVASILDMDKVHLLDTRRETGFDGLVAGSIEQTESGVGITLHLVDFSSGRIYYSDQLTGRFGSQLLTQLEDKVQSYAYALSQYYRSTLSVTSEPQAATVHINGQRAGVTPTAPVDVPDGSLEVRVSQEGYLPYVKLVDIRQGQKATLHVQLYRPALTVLSEPPGASVYVDGEYQGQTPMEDVSLSQLSFTVRIAKDGYADYEQTFALSTGEQAHVHARLYDLITDHLYRKKGRWTLDSHNIEFGVGLQFQNLSHIEMEAEPVTNLRYLARLGRWSLGIETALGNWHAQQRFDTFLGSSTGSSEFDVIFRRFAAVGQYNVFERLNQFDVYVGGQVGFTHTDPDQPQAEDLSLRQVNPTAGGELGFRFYFGPAVKLSAAVGGYYAGKFEYAHKRTSYWGEARYELRQQSLSPIYAGVTLTYSHWPALK